MTDVIRIAIVDDHPLFREGVTRSLSEIGGFEMAGEGATAQDAERIASTVRPDILLLDISMPGGGLAAVAGILASHPAQKIVMLTVSEANADVTMALNAGVRGYVLKGIGSRALADILRNVAAGESYLSPTLSARLLSDLQSQKPTNAIADRLRQLTERQTEILRLVAEGLSNKEVALRLELQEKTVKHHMTGVLSKLNVRNRTEAALMMRESRDRDRSHT
ncbi:MULTISPECIES: response regulator transcription factor [Mesorhizobium]|jgi:two-component system, NarL family, nitrate/nitrite response regulator NarL|uniref:LuxR family two component transcriptional regulator n=1 Tax=Rhizobium loti TaxID=381 RepID=A0A8E2WCD2_RHILI|nr:MULTISPECIES: response regulator transcription factor [Mesorhizobium]AZO40414.1 response regulator transcription factor [Mesorhizobium sp. M7D.F.Ca.US.005.01.1.1]PWJ91324.1 LuxR family two component transcriptional regulator [Mesorhizobium loti]RUX93615.1 response regulator transcription factor [Mesorhizobium sp. M7D.F.Ca.US.004.01.2.1]RVA27982.1 response regulator transcription factor [Mesorhizobium sp. M7D.F.Ca.US.004.03.1.1]